MRANAFIGRYYYNVANCTMLPLLGIERLAARLLNVIISSISKKRTLVSLWSLMIIAAPNSTWFPESSRSLCSRFELYSNGKRGLRRKKSKSKANAYCPIRFRRVINSNFNFKLLLHEVCVLLELVNVKYLRKGNLFRPRRSPSRTYLLSIIHV